MWSSPVEKLPIVARVFAALTFTFVVHSVLVGVFVWFLRSHTGLSWLHLRITLGGACGTVWDAGYQTWVGCMQGQHLTCCASSPAPFSLFGGHTWWFMESLLSALRSCSWWDVGEGVWVDCVNGKLPAPIIHSLQKLGSVLHWNLDRTLLGVSSLTSFYFKFFLNPLDDFILWPMGSVMKLLYSVSRHLKSSSYSLAWNDSYIAIRFTLHS